MSEDKKDYRSRAWFGAMGKDGFAHRSWLKNQGPPLDAFDGRPVIGICNSWSELTPCNAHLKDVAERVKRGVWEAGGYPFEFPVMSLGETLMRPTTMLFRNLMSMDVEESIRANPLDGVVLLSGCDKTQPAMMMGAASCDLPTVVLTGGPMLNGKFRGKDIGSGTDVWRFSEEVRAGTMTLKDFVDAEAGMSRSAGHCMSMGTASTMANLTEALGLTLAGAASVPAVDANRYRFAHLVGRRVVDMVKEDLRMSKVVTRQAFENAIRTNAAIGGSTNAIIHLIALAGRLGVPLEIEDFDELGRGVPLLVNLMPNGKYLMEDFYYAGGLPVVTAELIKHGLLHGDALTISGKSVAENIGEVKNFNEDVITPFDRPYNSDVGLAVLRGNLCPNGAVIKPSAATPALMKHRGRAVVFESVEELNQQVNDDALDIDENCIMVLKGAGPRGYPGMAEVGNFPLPRKILKRGITDMVRISDARMSGTAYGTVILHVAPESAAGGPLALVRTGDMIELDVEARRLHLDVSDEDLVARRANWQAPPPALERGYVSLYGQHVLQADRGCDLDFLVGASGAPVPRENH
jgi:dihydroxy-acid dehydratase